MCYAHGEIKMCQRVDAWETVKGNRHQSVNAARSRRLHYKLTCLYRQSSRNEKKKKKTEASQRRMLCFYLLHRCVSHPLFHYALLHGRSPLSNGAESGPVWCSRTHHGVEVLPTSQRWCTPQFTIHTNAMRHIWNYFTFCLMGLPNFYCPPKTYNLLIKWGNEICLFHCVFILLFWQSESLKINWYLTIINVTY